MLYEVITCISAFYLRFLLPWNELIQFGEHFINGYPVLQILGIVHMCPFIDHDPAHVGCAVLAGFAVPGFRGAAAVHGFKVRGPADEVDQPFWIVFPFVQGLGHRGTLRPPEGSA